eukprot:scaffold3951_cov121-Isochrysis_galbana.AAC.2
MKARFLKVSYVSIAKGRLLSYRSVFLCPDVAPTMTVVQSATTRLPVGRMRAAPFLAPHNFEFRRGAPVSGGPAGHSHRAAGSRKPEARMQQSLKFSHTEYRSLCRKPRPRPQAGTKKEAGSTMQAEG